MARKAETTETLTKKMAEIQQQIKILRADFAELARKKRQLEREEKADKALKFYADYGYMEEKLKLNKDREAQSRISTPPSEQ